MSTRSYRVGERGVVMKNGIVIGSLLLGVSILAGPIHAAQQGTGPVSEQYVSKKVRKLVSHSEVRYKGPPQFVSITETSISYATNTPEEIIHLGGFFYFNMQDVWLQSASSQGPWAVAQYVPDAVLAIVCSQLNANPLNPYQLCALPWSSGLSYAVWKP
jgi:hypothetical protein